MSSGSLPTLLRALVLALLVLSVLAGEDFYKVLGVSKGASDKEIKKAYPDKNSTPAAPQKFLDVGHAFEILSDPEKRKTYDKFGEEGLKQQQGGGGFHDPFDIFRNFGGGFNQQQGQRKGPGKVAEIEVDLEAIYKGDAMSFTIAKKAICDECDGSGARSDKDIVNCPHCEGKGIRLVRHQLAPGIFQQVQMHCDQCGAKGKITKHVCSVCKGTRVVDSVAELNLHIDRGVPEGTEVTFEGESDESPDHAAGDVVVRLKSKTKVGGFARKESNLIWKETLSVAEALLGFKRTVKGLDGHDIVISRTGVTQPGFVQVIPDEGLPIYHESGHGDLFVEYTVVLPSKISSKTQGLLSGALGYKIPDVTSGKTEL